MKNTTISSSLEDYLEAIAEIIEEQGHAHTKEIADHLKVKMPSVTNALQALSARGLIHYQSHSPVFLTPAGAGDPPPPQRAPQFFLRYSETPRE